MTEVGQRLRIERERRRLPRADVARATGVYIHHLTALEHGDHNDLPEDEIVAGYIRACAEHLELDAAALVAEFCRERGIPEPALVVEPPSPITPEPEETPPEAVEETAAADAPREDPSPASPLTSPSPTPVETPSTARRIPLPLLIAAGALLVLLLVWWLSGGAEESAPSEPPAEMPVTEVRTAIDPPAERTTDAPTTEVAPPANVSPQPDAAREVEREPSAAALPLTVTEHGIGTGVENHRLVGESDSFAAGTKVWFWTRVRGGAPEQTVRHVWLHEGQVVEGITLRLGSSNWRTQSAKTLYSTGRWAVEARNGAGAVLARSEFESTPVR